MTTVLPDIRLGPLRAEAVTVGVSDLSFLRGVDAIIGLDVLSRSSFSIDYKARQLTFGPLVAREPTARLEVTPPFLTVQLALAGEPVRLLVDTGSRGVSSCSNVACAADFRLRSSTANCCCTTCRGPLGSNGCFCSLSVRANRPSTASRGSCPTRPSTTILRGLTVCSEFGSSPRRVRILISTGTGLVSKRVGPTRL